MNLIFGLHFINFTVNEIRFIKFTDRIEEIGHNMMTILPDYSPSDELTIKLELFQTSVNFRARLRTPLKWGGHNSFDLRWISIFAINCSNFTTMPTETDSVYF